MNIENYQMVKSLEEAYTLNQDRMNVVYGGGCFLRLGDRSIQTVVDLSELHLNTIREDDQFYTIGAMVSLRQLEIHEGLNHRFYDIFKHCMSGIVGVPFRNCATIGGTIAQKVNFSDIIPNLMVLETYVELYPSGKVHIHEYMEKNFMNEIVVAIHIRKMDCPIAYCTFRKTATDLPGLVCSVAKVDDIYKISIGSRPAKAIYLESQGLSDEQIDTLVTSVAFSSNGLASKAYREQLAKVYLKRLRDEVLRHED